MITTNKHTISTNGVTAQCLSEWATPFVIIDFAGKDTLNQRLSRHILRAEKQYFERDHDIKPFPQNFNEFSQSWDKQNLLDWSGSEIREFREILQTGCQLFWDFAGPKERVFAPSRYVVWANVSRQADWHGHHSHYSGGSETFSGVYWVKAPKMEAESNQVDGHTIYYDPRGPFNPSRYRKILAPVPGRMILHPSWLPHSVAPLRKKTIRISIAFDVHCAGPF